jgi:nicotinate-nucleotide adenylyltransferase
MIIVYGGTFNPPTIAHFEIARFLIQKYRPAQFIFVPVGDAYKKLDVIDFNYRYQMLEILKEKLEVTMISNFENKAQTFKGTITTLDYYQSLYPNQPLYFVMGADNLKTLNRWIDADRLLNQYYFIVLNRNQSDLKKLIASHDLLLKYADHFIIEDVFPNYPLSSTMYRHERRDDVVLKEVNEFIYNHNLYNRGVK